MARHSRNDCSLYTRNDERQVNYIEVERPKCCPLKMCFGMRGDKVSFKKSLFGCPAKCCRYTVQELYVTHGEGNDTVQIIKTARDNTRAKMN